LCLFFCHIRHINRLLLVLLLPLFLSLTAEASFFPPHHLPAALPPWLQSPRIVLVLLLLPLLAPLTRSSPLLLLSPINCLPPLLPLPACSFRHLMLDIGQLLPHCKRDAKMDSKSERGVINEVADLKVGAGWGCAGGALCRVSVAGASTRDCTFRK
jgi:hypothetical protein